MSISRTGLVLSWLVAAAGGAVADLERGQEHLKRGDLAAAAAAFEAASNADPKDARAHYLRGVVLDKQGDDKRAETAYRDALRHQPDFPEARNNLGAIFLQRGRLAEAERAFTDVLRGHPAFADAHFNLGALRDAQGRFAEAAAAYREAVRHKAGDPDYHVNLAVALRRAGDSEGAITALRRALALDGRHVVALTNLGLLLSDKQAFDEAKALLHRATTADPKSAAAWHALGRVALRQKAPDEAWRPLQTARTLDPKSGEIAADVCRAAVDREAGTAAAAAACRAALEIEAQHALARYLLAKSLVAAGDCAAGRHEIAIFAGLREVKDATKAAARRMVERCRPGSAAPASARSPAGTGPDPIPVSGADLLGLVAKAGSRLVIVNVWASWCEPCKKELPDILDVYRRYKARGVALFLVSADFPDTRRDAVAFLSGLGVDFPTYVKSGDDMKFIDAVDPQWTGAIPVTILFDGAGRCLHRFSGSVAKTALRSQIDRHLDHSRP